MPVPFTRNEKLYEACKKGVLAEVCTALEVDGGGGIDVNYRGDGGRTPLYWASTNGHFDVVRHLLSVNDIQVNQARDNGITALYMASQEGHVDVVRLLLGVEGVEVNQARDNGTTALFMASTKGHVDVVRLLLGAEGVEVNQGMSDGDTALSIASHQGHVEVTRLLLGAKGIDARHVKPGWDKAALALDNEDAIAVGIGIKVSEPLPPQISTNNKESIAKDSRVQIYNLKGIFEFYNGHYGTVDSIRPDGRYNILIDNVNGMKGLKRENIVHTSARQQETAILKYLSRQQITLL